MNNFSYMFEKNEAVFLVVAALLTIPMAWLFMKAGRELMKEPPPHPSSPSSSTENQRKEL